MLVRLQKYPAETGVASRRSGEKLIVEGRVSVNGRTITTLGSKIDPVRDRVEVNGLLLKPKRKLYVAVNKPPGVLCTRHDPQKRRTVGQLLPREWTSLYAVGRLDRDSEGLLFLTNDGAFALHLTHPRYGVRKKYRVEVEGKVDSALASRLAEGVVHNGERLQAKRARLLSANHTRSLLELELAEGKNREIRRLLEALGFRVLMLCRIQIGPIKLGELPLGKWRTLTETEINSLLSA